VSNSSSSSIEYAANLSNMNMNTSLFSVQIADTGVCHQSSHTQSRSNSQSHSHRSSSQNRNSSADRMSTPSQSTILLARTALLNGGRYINQTLSNFMCDPSINRYRSKRVPTVDSFTNIQSLVLRYNQVEHSADKSQNGDDHLNTSSFFEKAVYVDASEARDRLFKWFSDRKLHRPTRNFPEELYVIIAENEAGGSLEAAVEQKQSGHPGLNSVKMSLKNKQNLPMHVLIFDQDRSIAQCNCAVLELRGWECYAVASLAELTSYQFISSVDAVIIDDDSNALYMRSSDVDLARHLRLLGFDGAIISLTNVHGQKTYSSEFDGAVSKPIIESSVDVLTLRILQKFYASAIMLQEC